MVKKTRTLYESTKKYYAGNYGAYAYDLHMHFAWTLGVFWFCSGRKRPKTEL